jgi:D-alanyl-D-alanine dipeptidase
VHLVPALSSLGALAALVLWSTKVAEDSMTDVSKAASGIQVDLRYATEDNFFHQRFYKDDTRALLRPATTKKLAAAQDEFFGKGLSLKVWDAFRPLHVQREMWKVKPDSNYVANPANGSRHNRGAAVDVTLVDKDGRELDMGTAFDDFSAKAHLDAAGLTEAAQKNRGLLRTVMERHGFKPLKTEWWHFDDADWEKYGLVE